MKRTAIPRRYLTPAQRVEVCRRQQYVCPECGENLIGEIEYDHRVPLGLTGTNETENLQALHAHCHKAKTAKEDIPRIRKAARQDRKHGTSDEHIAERKRRAAKKPKIGNRGWDTTWKKTVDGRTVRR